MTRGVSEGILAAHRHGIVSSTTVLVTAELDRTLVGLLLESGLGVGLHVNLTLGKPLTRGRSLVDDNGRFVRDARHAAARATAADVRAEVEAQVAKFEKTFRRAPTHLDSHHHVGLHPPVRDVVLQVARDIGVPVRSQDDAARMRARSTGLRTPDHFFGESGPGAYWSPATTLAMLRALPPGVSEFMTHPGWFDADLAYSRYGRQRETEMVGLGTPAARAAVSALGIALCTFAEIRR
jgi:predicted glycoside hydrolase/deacetylase ChbG (UPF0249 family)